MYEAGMYKITGATLDFGKSKWKFSTRFVPRLKAALISVTGLVASGGGGSTNEKGMVPTISSVSVACSPTSILSNQTSTCTPTVQGTGSFTSSVTWAASAGSISTTGVFTPPSVSAATNHTVTATSVQDSTKSGTA